MPVSYTHLVNPPRSDEDILMQTTQENAPNGRLLLCRDSFGNALHPFLAEDFREAIIDVYKRQGLTSMGYHCVKPDGAFYLFPQTLEADDRAFSERAKKYDLSLIHI